MTEETKDDAIIEEISSTLPKDPSKIVGSVNVPLAMVNKSSLYGLRTKSDTIGASVNVGRCDLTSSDNLIRDSKLHRIFKETKASESTFDNLSPNVKRMVSSATETTALKFQKKTLSVGRSSTRHKSNIPLVGATSKISQSGVDILPSVEIYDQPCLKNLGKHKIEETSPTKAAPIKPDFKIDEQTTYDVPTNNRPAIYDVPNAANKTAFESLSLPYIDQSIELSISSNDREFDIKLSSKDNSPQKPDVKIPSPNATPAKLAKTLNGTNSLHRKDFKSNGSPKHLLKTAPYPESIGSTGNLKTLTIPEKEVIRLNPPTVEVSRPLSMSSIASSSSTSSSGVQNKGGVNSAYLASIESLDDHSDADMTSANGSNNFVNKAGIVNAGVSQERHSADVKRDQPPDEMSGLTQLERVCAEIVQTENVYVEDLRQVVEGYLHIWRTQSTFSDEELSELFNNIEAIYSFNRSLCDELNSCKLDATCIARCFVNNTCGFAVYTSYCTGYPRTMARLAALASRPESAREFRDRQLALGHPLPLASYLLKPVQRILKYHLLLQNVVKQCASSETEYALLKMTGIAQHIDDMKRRHEHAVRVQEIQSLLYGWNGPDLTTYGELCAEGTFRVLGAKGMRHVFLFDKMLLVTKNREDGILAYKSHIMCNNMMLVEAIAGAPLAFHAIPWDSPRSQLTLQARSPRHKREWTLLLKRVILENYNAVIPSHARQLVMELGQNKTDDDMLAEKSHNLITQASMRKQLSAPEYLEKRKIDRERRKSFENGIRGRMKKVNRKYTISISRHESSQECDCAQVSAEKGIDYTCDHCYIDLCSDCESAANKSKVNKSTCNCKQEDCDTTGDKCPECDRSLRFIDCGSTEHLERKQSDCKCSDFKSSQESFIKDYPVTLNKIRGYHSSDNIVGYTESNESREDLCDTNVRAIPKTCLKCAKIKENIPVTESQATLHGRKSRCSSNEKYKTDSLRSKSKDDPQRSKLSKIGTWRRKSEPGLQQNTIISKKSQDSDSERNDVRGSEKIEFECRNCGSNKISRKLKNNENALISDPEVDRKRCVIGSNGKPNVEIRMYNTKNVPKKISKLKKNRAKGFRLGSDTTAKFYADFSTDISTENILHISESNDSLNIDKSQNGNQNLPLPDTISKDEDIDEETYKKLIEKTDSFKKNELEKVKYLNKQKVIAEGSEVEERDKDTGNIEDVSGNTQERCEEIEQPLEQIISQLLMQNRDFQKLLKKQQQRNSAQRRHQRLLKSYSNPEHVISKIKPRYSRQTSEDINVIKAKEEEEEIIVNEKLEEEIPLVDDHIYETLRVEKNDTDNLHSLNTKSKVIQHHAQISRPKRLPSPPMAAHNLPEIIMTNPESDYVYLSFDKLNKTQDADGIYDVPVKSPGNAFQMKTDYYVTMEHKKPAKSNEDNLYDSLVEVCKRKKEESNFMPTDYLPMSPDQQCPNKPEIWLSRQKEHFNVCRDRKSGSLPRSFQVVVNTEDNDLNSFKCKPNSTCKTYLSRDGKVMSTDRPFTIASDKSDISYDDVENYMSDGDKLKFNKNSKCSDAGYPQNISQSTLELEEEIDRCYKNNFQELELDKNKNENLLTVSQPNLNTSATSSCEVLPVDSSNDKTTDIDVIHPEHKIYKPTSNLLSLRNVLSRFKNKTPNKNSDDREVNANDQSSPDSLKSDMKSPTNEKRSALNPRSYSKNLLQRFKSIIGDEHFDTNQNKADVISRQTSSENSKTNTSKRDIQVVITTQDTFSDNTTRNSLKNENMSNSVCEPSTLTASQIEKSKLEPLSNSCDNISTKYDKPSFDKSISLISNISNSISNSTSPSKSRNTSYQNLNKLPIYMQGSKHLGARIAQSDYVDPSSLASEISTMKNVNILINKNAVRPDSLFSNYSFVTSSSEGTCQDNQSKTKSSHTFTEKIDVVSDLNTQQNTDESYYEKSFERIEHMLEEDVFRDSAVYSDPDDTDEIRTEAGSKTIRSLSRSRSIKKEDQFRCQNISITSNLSSKPNSSRIAVSIKKAQEFDKFKDQKVEYSDKNKPKTAPPVPAKPKIGIITSSRTTQKSSGVNKVNTACTSSNQTSTELINVKTSIKRSTNSKSSVVKSPSISNDKPIEEIEANNIPQVNKDNNTVKSESSTKLKRLGFERASLDSATRKIKTFDFQKINEQPKTSKSVLERRMEIELLSKSQTTNRIPHKSVQKPKPITKKVATFERALSDNTASEVKSPLVFDKDDEGNTTLISKTTNEQQSVESNELDPKSSWVKQVVNKFQ